MATKKTTARPARPARKAPKAASTEKAGARKAPKAEDAAAPKKAPSKRARKAQKAVNLTRVERAPARDVEPSKQARETALLAAQAALEKKALDVEILDVASKVDYADLLVLMSGTSDRHVASLVQGIEEELKKNKIRAISVEGMPTAIWVLIDFGDVVVHVFQQDARSDYDIGRLWMDAGRVPLPARAQPPAPPARPVLALDLEGHPGAHQPLA